MAIIDWITQFALHHSLLVYVVITFLALLEGHLITLVCGLLSRLGYLDVYAAWMAIIIGNLTGDIILYWVGYIWGEKFVVRYGKYFNITEQTVEAAKKIFRRYHSSILLGSKVTNGFGLAVAILFTAGVTRVPFRRFMILNTCGEVVWTTALLTLGYYFGHFYATINNIFARVSLIAFGVVALYAFFRFTRYMREKIYKQIHTV